MTAIPIGIAAEIRAEMARQHMSVASLAELSNLSEASVYRKVHHPTRSMSLEELSSISAALKIRPSELMRRAETSTSEVA